MTELVGDVVELARAPGQDAIARQDVALDELTRDAIERAAAARPRDAASSSTSSPRWSTPTPQRLGRAISNMLDNASEVEPAGRDRSTSPSPAARSPSATTARASPTTTSTRSSTASGAPTTPAAQPGSGLGLAIVQRVAEEHDGSASASNADGRRGGGQPASCPRSSRTGPERQLELEARVGVVDRSSPKSSRRRPSR